MKKVLVVFGSKSSEHEISCMSAYSILKNIDRTRYNVMMLGIDKLGEFYNYTGSLDKVKDATWIEDSNNIEKIDNIIEYLKKFDVIFPVLHGKYGEDGTIQGIFEYAGVKYVGCDVLGSSLCMNKSVTKELVETFNIPVVEYVDISREIFEELSTDESNFSKFASDLEEKLNFPMFVKPNREGSSYGVSKVNDKLELKEAIEYALSFDNHVLIEEFISKKSEVECAVIKKDGNVIVSTPGEIISCTEVYDYDAKYNNSSSYVKIPAQISDNNIQLVKKYSKEIFNKLNLSSLARIDFFVTDKKVYLNEINTMPGFTDISMFPMMLIYDGINYSEIINILIEEACNNNI